jgi:hypothetical protein
LARVSSRISFLKSDFGPIAKTREKIKKAMDRMSNLEPADGIIPEKRDTGRQSPIGSAKRRAAKLCALSLETPTLPHYEKKLPGAIRLP